MSRPLIENFFTSAWRHQGWLAWALSPVAALFGTLSAMRRHAFLRSWIRACTLPVPVIVVGNRIVGGAGKTPTTIEIIKHLQQTGWRPGILTRGYKRAQDTSSDAPLLLDETTARTLNAQATGDEPLLLWRHTHAPVMIHRQRSVAGLALLKTHPDIDILVCDDGLQHLQLKRDIEVIVFDERGQGNGWLLPAGPLREPIHAPSYDSLVAPPIVLYNCEAASTPLPGHLSTKATKPLQTLQSWWAGDAPPVTNKLNPDAGPVHALAGIAQPAKFFDALRSQGFDVVGIPLADHDHFETLPWPVDCTHVVVTEKDAIKLTPDRIQRERPHTTVWVAGLDFHPADTFWHALDSALSCVQPRHSTL